MSENSIAKLEDFGAFGSGALQAMDDIDTDVLEAELESSPAFTGTPFIAFDHKTGIYTVGKEATQLPDRQWILLDPMTAKKGFMAFIKGQRLPEKKMAKFDSKEAVTTDDLPKIDSKYGWRPAGSVFGTLIGGPRSGLDVSLEGMGVHFKGAFDDLFRNNPTNPKGIAAALLENKRLPPEKRKIFPLVELTFRTYTPSGETEQKIAHQFLIKRFLTIGSARILLKAAHENAAQDILDQVSAGPSFDDDEELEDALPETEVEAEVVNEPIRRQPRRK